MNNRRPKDHAILGSSSRWGLALFLALVPSCFGVSQHEVFTNAIAFNGTDELKGVKGLDQEKATLANPSAAKEFLTQMRKVQKGCTVEAQQPGDTVSTPSMECLPLADGNDKNTYILIHLLRWLSSSTSTQDKPKVEAEHWYLYRNGKLKDWSQEDFTSTKRLMGVNKVYVLYVHLNAGPAQLVAGAGATYTPNYDITVSKKTPANVAHLYALLQTFASGTNATKAAEVAGAETRDSVWGGGTLGLQYRPSDILIKSTFRPHPDDPDQKLADDITFDNEGAYYWDVGFAVPVRKISELKLDTTSGTATPAKVNSQNVFAVLDGYLRPVDVKGSAFTAIPHPIVGVAFAKQPLSKILIGGAWGPKASELYMGAMFVKQPELSGSKSCSSPAGTSLTGKSHYCAQFTIGINLSVSAIASKLGAPK